MNDEKLVQEAAGGPWRFPGIVVAGRSTQRDTVSIARLVTYVQEIVGAENLLAELLLQQSGEPPNSDGPDRRRR